MHLDESTLWVPQSEHDKELVRAQLERLLETHHFRNSRRYPALFRFIVEETLAGRGEYLKERLIGIQVFGRLNSYDTAADPVVRVTAAEIRKRIAQYYHEPAHGNEMRIELVPGSYEPEFRPGVESATEHLPSPAAPAASLPIEPAPETTAAVAKEAPRLLRRRYVWGAVALCALIAVVTGVMRFTAESALQELWSPILTPGRAVMVVLPIAGGRFGDNARPQQPTPPGMSRDPWSSFLQLETGGENVVFSDVTAMTLISNLLASRHAETRLRLNDATTLDDLREGPTVLIGGMDNQWTLRALSRLRYRFAGSDADAYWIEDTRDPGNRRWSLDLKTRIPNVTTDYALIARVHDEATGQPQLIVAGIGMCGTAAAGELVVSPRAVEELRRMIGASAFRDRDFEAVVRTDVINGIAGSAKVLTVDVR